MSKGTRREEKAKETHEVGSENANPGNQTSDTRSVVKLRGKKEMSAFEARKERHLDASRRETHPVKDSSSVVSSSGVGDETPESSEPNAVDGESRLVAVSEDLGGLSIESKSVERWKRREREERSQFHDRARMERRELDSLLEAA